MNGVLLAKNVSVIVDTESIDIFAMASDAQCAF